MKIVVLLYNFIATLCYPIVLFLLLLALTLFIKQKRWIKWAIIGVMATLYLLSSGVVNSIILEKMEQYPPLTRQVIANHRAIIVLGGGLSNSNGMISPKMPAYSRILQAFKIYHLGRQMAIHYTIFVSGGDVDHNGISEAEVYAQILEQLGVSRRDLVLEKRSRNTYQNAQYLKEIIKNYPFKHYLLVTTGLHMERALLYFNNFNIHVTPVMADRPMPIGKWLPAAYNLSLFERVVHEQAGIIRLYLYNRLGLN